MNQFTVTNCKVIKSLHRNQGPTRTYLPELHLNSTVQLYETCFQVHILALRIVYVDCTLLILVFVDVSQMGA